MLMRRCLMAAMSLMLFAGPAAADRRGGAPRHEDGRLHACLRGGWNHPACAHIGRKSSMDYYYHHDPRHAHGMAFGP